MQVPEGLPFTFKKKKTIYPGYRIIAFPLLFCLLLASGDFEVHVPVSSPGTIVFELVEYCIVRNSPGHLQSLET